MRGLLLYFAQDVAHEVTSCVSWSWQAFAMLIVCSREASRSNLLSLRLMHFCCITRRTYAFRAFTMVNCYLIQKTKLKKTFAVRLIRLVVKQPWKYSICRNVVERLMQIQAHTTIGNICPAPFFSVRRTHQKNAQKSAHA